MNDGPRQSASVAVSGETSVVALASPLVTPGRAPRAGGSIVSGPSHRAPNGVVVSAIGAVRSALGVVVVPVVGLILVVVLITGAGPPV